MSACRHPGALRRRALVALIAAVLVATVPVPGTHPPAGASGDSGASSRVIGRGEILTSIFARRGGGRPTTGTAPVCRWRTLDDADLEWLVELTVLAIRLGIDSPLFEHLGPYVGGTLPDGDYQLRVCDGEVVESRFTPRDTAPPLHEVMVRRMITRLPLPEPRFSPPPEAPVPVGQPVFVSIPPPQWAPIEATLAHDGRVATVRAEPVALRVVSGDPASDAVLCDGPGVPFDPTSARSARLQSLAPDACTVTYRTANRRPDPHGAPPGWVFRELAERPPSWIGSVTVVWDARWRLDDGPWQSLGTIQRTRLVDRTVRELHTTVRSGR
jgi:hypothetical protein